MAESRASAIAALRCHLTKYKYEIPVTTLEDVVKFINCCYCYTLLVVDIAEEKLKDRKWIMCESYV